MVEQVSDVETFEVLVQFRRRVGHERNAGLQLAFPDDYEHIRMYIIGNTFAPSTLRQALMAGWADGLEI